MVRRTWIAIPTLAVGVLLALLASAQGTRGAQLSLDDLLQADGTTREQMVVHMLEALEEAELTPPECVPGQEMFDDVPASSPFCPAIEEMARRGITSGCGGNNFCPGASVSRAQMASFIVTTLEEADGCWPTVPGTGRMVKVGSVCIDGYENSVWTGPNGGQQLTTQEQISAFCPANGQDCKGQIFARSVAGVEPARSITWFQAQQALANSGKRLPTNAEWQMAASGTPDGAPCNVNASDEEPVNTGSAAGCISDWGAFDMVGNVSEWVADWIPSRTCVGDWPAGYGGDFQGICGAAESGAPGALVRGGDFVDDSFAGPFAVNAFLEPSDWHSNIGFRGAR